MGSSQALKIQARENKPRWLQVRGGGLWKLVILSGATICPLALWSCHNFLAPSPCHCLSHMVFYLRYECSVLLWLEFHTSIQFLFMIKSCNFLLYMIMTCFVNKRQKMAGCGPTDNSPIARSTETAKWTERNFVSAATTLDTIAWFCSSVVW